MGARARFGSQLWGRGMAANEDDENEFSDVTLEELREFLEADVMEAQADPAFKERLRKKLWELVRTQSGRPHTSEGEV
jgi:hypothetical protein